MPTIKELQAEIAEALQIKATGKRFEKALNARIVRCGIGIPCGRCGGSGRYSFNPIDGTVCYGCGGWGYRAPKKKAGWETVALNAERARADGTVDRYLRILEARRATKKAGARVLQAWKDTGISDRYDWCKAAEATRVAKQGLEVSPELAYHREISDINRIMADAHTDVSDAELALRRAARCGTREEQWAATEALAETLQKALEAIAQAKVELDQALAKWEVKGMVWEKK